MNKENLKLVFPVLKPGNWQGLENGALFDTLLGTGEEVLLVKAYGYDLVSEYRFLTQLDLEEVSPEEIRIHAQRNLENHQVEVKEISQLEGQVLYIQDDQFASEKVLDKSLMQSIGEHLQTNELIASIPRRGLLIIAPERLKQNIFDGFLKISKEAFSHNNGKAPITDLILTLESGKVSGAFES